MQSLAVEHAVEDARWLLQAHIAYAPATATSQGTARAFLQAVQAQISRNREVIEMRPNPGRLDKSKVDAMFKLYQALEKSQFARKIYGRSKSK